MTAQARLRYPTQAKVDFAIKMARRAGIVEIGAVEFTPDGAIRIVAKAENQNSVEAEIERWKAARPKG